MSVGMGWNSFSRANSSRDLTMSRAFSTCSSIPANRLLLEFRVAFPEFLDQDLGRTGDVAQRVVEFVGDPRGQGAQGRHFFPLDQLLGFLVELPDHFVQHRDQGMDFGGGRDGRDLLQVPLDYILGRLFDPGQRGDNQ